MVKNNNSGNKIKISNLKIEELSAYLKIEFDAFYDKLKFIYSNRRDAAYNILTEEISENIGISRYFTSKNNGTVIGIIELITEESLSGFKRNFTTYLKYLGFFRALKAYLLNRTDIPSIGRDTLYVENVAVDSGNRGRGFGREMLSFAEDYSRKNGKNKMKLWVAKENIHACRLYRDFGFYEVTVRSSWIAGRYFGYRDWIFMEKNI